MLTVEYLAGFFDGEGCFFLRKPTGTSTCNMPLVTVCNTNFEIMRAIAYTLDSWNVDYKFRNSRPVKGNRKPSYDITIQKRKSVYEFCCIMRGHLKVKYEQNEILIKYIELRDVEGRKGKMHQYARAVLFSRIRELNKRGTER